jgi:hypothetical protein
MFTFAKHSGLAAVGVIVLGAASAAQAQFRMAPGAAQGPYGAGTAGAAGAGPNFFSSGAGQGVLSSLGPYNSFSSTPVTTPYGGGGGGYGNSPYYMFYGPYFNPANGNLYGAAAVIDASGQYMTSVHQAYLMREQVRREKLENRRRIFDQWLYERNNTPTNEDERERFQRLALRRAQNDPPTPEILSARALNDLLLDAQKLQGKGVKGPDIPLNDGLLTQINFVPKGKVAANAGLLKNYKLKGRLGWPEAFQSPAFSKDRELMDSLAKDAMNQAAQNGQVDFGTVTEMRNVADRLRQGLSVAIRREGLPPTPYAQASNFLSALNSSIRALSDPDAKSFFDGKHVPQAANVGDLVRDMTGRGLEFAPATTGEDSAYVALHRLLSNYDTLANASSLYAEQQPPPR